MSDLRTPVTVTGLGVTALCAGSKDNPKEETVTWFRNFQGPERWGHSSSPPSGKLEVTVNAVIMFCSEIGPQFCAVLPCPVLTGVDPWVPCTTAKQGGWAEC